MVSKIVRQCTIVAWKLPKPVRLTPSSPGFLATGRRWQYKDELPATSASVSPRAIAGDPLAFAVVCGPLGLEGLAGPMEHARLARVFQISARSSHRLFLLPQKKNMPLRPLVLVKRKHRQIPGNKLTELPAKTILALWQTAEYMYRGC